jgi:hypothetical protein
LRLIPTLWLRAGLMPRFQFTIRWLVVTVVVAGIVCGVVEFKIRRNHSLELAAFHARWEAICVNQEMFDRWIDEADAQFAAAIAEIEAEKKIIPIDFAPRDRYPLPLSDAERFPPPAEPPVKSPPVAKRAAMTPHVSKAAWYRDRTAWHAAMRTKYEHAARYPWLPVAPDPPEPE